VAAQASPEEPARRLIGAALLMLLGEAPYLWAYPVVLVSR
jgi:hypothetical protein